MKATEMSLKRLFIIDQWNSLEISWSGSSLFPSVGCATWNSIQPTNSLFMVGYIDISEDESKPLIESKNSRSRPVMEFKSIFTYSAQSDPLSDKGSSANNNMTEYYSVPKDDAELSKYETAFDYKSIFSYSTGSNKKTGKVKSQEWDTSSTEESPPNDKVDYVISNTILILSYIVVFFTLPISVWFCFKHLPQWERIVVYRIGKLHGVLGPGNIFVIPWLDTLTKLDLRTQLISHPPTQVTICSCNLKSSFFITFCSSFSPKTVPFWKRVSTFITGYVILSNTLAVCVIPSFKVSRRSLQPFH